MYLSPRFWMTGWNFLANLPKPCGLFCAANVKNYWRCAYFSILPFARAILPFARTIFWGTTTGTTYTTMQLFSLFSLSCIFHFGRQQQQLIQQCSCSRCYSCRVFYFGRQRGQPLQQCSCSRCYSFCFRHSDCLFTFAQQDSTKEKRAVKLGFVTKNLKNFGPSQVKYYLCLQ